MFRSFLCTAAMILTCSAEIASAATFNFETQDPSNGQELNFTVGDLSLNVKAGEGDRVINAINGLGVNSANRTGDTQENGLITLGESLIFTLSPRPIKSLVSVVFEGGREIESIDFVVGNNRRRLSLNAADTNGQSRVSFDLSNELPSGTTQFSFVGVEEKQDGLNRGVLISSLEIAAVPVPAAILSLGTGLALFGALGGLRRGSHRKRLLGEATA